MVYIDDEYYSKIEKIRLAAHKPKQERKNNAASDAQADLWDEKQYTFGANF